LTRIRPRAARDHACQVIRSPCRCRPRLSTCGRCGLALPPLASGQDVHPRAGSCSLPTPWRGARCRPR